MEHGDAGVPYLYSAYLPTEDICFCLFGANVVRCRPCCEQPGPLVLGRVTNAAPLIWVDAEACPDHHTPNPGILRVERPR